MCGEPTLPPSEPLERFRAAWGAGKIVVLAVVADGLHTGAEVACSISRGTFLHYMPRIHRDLTSISSFADSVRGSIRGMIAKDVTRLTPPSDERFRAELVIMMAMKIAIGEAAVEGSGLSTISIVVDEDARLPWKQRGMLGPEKETA